MKLKYFCEISVEYYQKHHVITGTASNTNCARHPYGKTIICRLNYLELTRYIRISTQQVTCPGVWLCQNGNVSLSFSALDYNFRSQPHPPRFPLLVHETFKMEGNYSEPVASVTALERLIGKL